MEPRSSRALLVGQLDQGCPTMGRHHRLACRPARSSGSTTPPGICKDAIQRNTDSHADIWRHYRRDQA
eukprot:2436637-Amphidinium_carterae.1